MKQKLIDLLMGLVALAMTEPEKDKEIADGKAQIKLLQDEIATLHGDCELNDPEVVKAINDAAEVLASLQVTGASGSGGEQASSSKPVESAPKQPIAVVGGVDQA